MSQDARNNQNSQFRAAISLLESLPQFRRDAVTAFILFWFGSSSEEQATLVKLTRPELRDVDVARIVGVNRCTLSGWKRYQRVKPWLADFKNIKHRGSKRRKNGRGSWVTTDNPD